MADQLTPVYWRALDSNGNAVASATATWYESGTSTPLTVYTDEALSTPHATPQVADSSGVFAQVFVTSGTAAKVVVKDTTGSTLYTIDPVPLTSTGGQAASNITFSAVTGISDTDVQAAIETLNTRTLVSSNSNYLKVSAGSGGTFTLTPNTAITAYADGQHFEFVANQASVGSGSDTLNVGGVGAVVIKKYADSPTKTDLSAGEVTAGDVVRVKHDGTHFVLVSPTIATTDSHGLVEAATTAEMTAGTADKFPDASAVKAHVTAQAKLARETEDTSTSVTEIDFTGLPAGTSEVRIYLTGVSLNGTDNLLIQIGDSGGIETTGYNSGAGTGSGGTTSTAGFVMIAGLGSYIVSGIVVIEHMGSNKWVMGALYHVDGATDATTAGGFKTLSGELDRVRITVTGANQIDANSGIQVATR